MLMPLDMQDWLPERHLARFISDVVDELDLSAILLSYEKRDGRGQPPYHPKLMIGLLLYAYCTGEPSSRKIEEATYMDVAFRVLACDQHPDHASIALFRKRHLAALKALFLDVLQLCEKAGLIRLGNVAVDGSKIQANASKHKAMSYERMCQTQLKLEAEIAALLKKAETVDAAEDEKYGSGGDGVGVSSGKGERLNELPQELERRESRLKVIREAKQALEEEARERAREEAKKTQAKLEEREQREEETGKKARGRKPTVKDPEQAKPKGKAQRNFTDPESRIMVNGATKGFDQAYNAQAAVDGHKQIILAAEITQEANDKQQLAPMVKKVVENTGKKPERVTADSGYFSEAAVTDKVMEGMELYVAVARQKHGAEIETADDDVQEEAAAANTIAADTIAADDAANEPTIKEQMQSKLKTVVGAAAYSLRKTIVEPVFGQIKEERGFRRFSFRGVANVAAEWTLICLTHNLLKLFRHGPWKMSKVRGEGWTGRQPETWGAVALNAG